MPLLTQRPVAWSGPSPAAGGINRIARSSTSSAAAALWAELNASLLTSFRARSPAALLGHCDAKCAQRHWKALGGSGDGPICGVAGCGPDRE